MNEADTERCIKCSSHEWVAFSTALSEGWIMVQCVECGLHGTIEDPSKEEWGEASHAPSRPYRWLDTSRVREKSVGDFYVARASERKPCDCMGESSRHDSREYDRIPAEITRRHKPISERARREIIELADCIGDKPEMCSRLFPVFVEGFIEYSGRAYAPATLEIVSRIERFGMHMANAVVARVLRTYANWKPAATNTGSSE
jgi:hypothetical protein